MKEKKQFGLIGRNIDYSFSRNYFTKKFSAIETLSNYEYVNFDIESVEEVTSIFKQKNIYGLNVTIPYKESIIKYLDELDNIAFEIGSVNTICYEDKKDYISYNDLNKKIFSDPVLIVNCTPIGTYPNVNSSPNLPYDIISDKSIFFDLVYNPEETLFMKKGNEIGCLTINGYQMLKFQAEESWNLWQRK